MHRAPRDTAEVFVSNPSQSSQCTTGSTDARRTILPDGVRVLCRLTDSSSSCATIGVCDASCNACETAGLLAFSPDDQGTTGATRCAEFARKCSSARIEFEAGNIVCAQ